MITPNCIKCGKELAAFGGIILGIPIDDRPPKYHVCVDCMLLLDQWMADKVEPIKYHYVINGKQEVFTEPMFYFVWTYGEGTTEFAGHMTQSEYDARALIRRMEFLSDRKFKSKQQMTETFL